MFHARGKSGGLVLASMLTLGMLPAAVNAAVYQAENYSQAHDTTAGNQGGAFRAGDVDIESTRDAGGGFNVGWIDKGEWLIFDGLQVPNTATYRITLRVASPSGGKVKVDLNAGTTVLANIDVPATGGWQNWATVVRTVTVPAGNHRLGVYATTGGWNFNWIEVTPVGDSGGGGGGTVGGFDPTKWPWPAGDGGQFGAGATGERGQGTSEFVINLFNQPKTLAQLSRETGYTQVTGGNYPDTPQGAINRARQIMGDTARYNNPLPPDMPYRAELFSAAVTYGIDPILAGKMAVGESSVTIGLPARDGDPAQSFTGGLLQANTAPEHLKFRSGNQALDEALLGMRQLRGEINASVQYQGLSGAKALQKGVNFYNTGNFTDAWSDFSRDMDGAGNMAPTYWEWIATRPFDGNYGNGQ